MLVCGLSAPLHLKGLHEKPVRREHRRGTEKLERLHHVAVIRSRCDRFGHDGNHSLHELGARPASSFVASAVVSVESDERLIPFPV